MAEWKEITPNVAERLRQIRDRMLDPTGNCYIPSAQETLDMLEEASKAQGLEDDAEYLKLKKVLERDIKNGNAKSYRDADR